MPLRQTIYIFIFFICSLHDVMAQNGWNIKGSLLDDESQAALEFASVLAYNANNQEMVNGSISDANGKFIIKNLPAGTYFLEVKFLGYETQKTKTFELNKSNINIGTITVSPASKVMEGVVVEAQRTSVNYNLDKKVLNVSSISTALAGTAVEVLENLPAVNVDAEGNVSLRGSSDFTVFIDGRPSVFTGSEALQQLPASTIDKIEVITNPSAKYDPDGTAGIINIITKKKVSGLSGVANIHGGNWGRMGADGLLTYKLNKWNLYLGGDYNKRVRAGERSSYNESYFGDTTYVVRQNGDAQRWFDPYSIKMGFDYMPGKKDMISLMVNAGQWGMGNEADQSINSITTINGNEISNIMSSSTQEGNIAWRYLSADLTYTHTFDENGHKLDFSGMFRGSDMDQFDKFFNVNDLNEYERPAQNSTEEKQGQEFRAKIDHTLPIGADHKLESGYQGRFENTAGSNTIFFQEEPEENWQISDDFSYENEYARTIHGLYTMIGGKFNKLGYQLGLRGEFTDRTVTIVDTEENFHINRFDFFPSAHFSYQLPDQQQFMISYSKRINRPRSYYLEPFLTFQDAYNVRSGNPDLLPEYIHSMEVGYQNNFGDFSFSAEGYYRITENRIQWVQSVWQEDIMLRNPENVGEEYTAGLEMMITGPLFPWWNINVSGNAGTFRLEGTFEGQTFNRSNVTGSARLNNDFMLGKTTKLQFGMQYNAPTISAQGEIAATFTANAAIKQEIIKNQLSATISGRNIFKTFAREQISFGENFYNEMRIDARMFIEGTITYSINNYKVKKGRGGEGGGMDMDF
ncbi:TonB-dependent receptor [Persicobacter diffluens]|uniref:TonB-dependent receptor n=2 Tax=Persicobacter diffluens TaxID=981 RepID=A0AAN5AKU4_9BACT|nr:TonB-dependent receptor [Persicobacter diffluens]